MKRFFARLLSVSCLFAVPVSPGAAFDMMSKPDCINGPSSYDPGINGALNKLDARIVACHNFQNQMRHEDYDRLANAIQTLASEVNTLEHELARLKAEKP